MAITATKMCFVIIHTINTFVMFSSFTSSTDHLIIDISVDEFEFFRSFEPNTLFHFY